MAVTIEKIIDYKAFGDPVAIPVASGETIYGGTLACIDKTGLLRNLSSTYVHQARAVVLVADNTAKIDGPAATTGAGSISSTDEGASAVAGDKTVRLCYMNCRVKLTFTAIAQSDVGKTVYASDNYTCDESQASSAKIGTLVTYLSATSGWVMLNNYYSADGIIKAKVALTACTTTTAGGVLSWQNPTGEAIIVHDLVLDITTAPSDTAGGVDVGIASTVASNDALLDGLVLAAATTYSCAKNAGTNGGMNKKCAADYYLTATSNVGSHESLAGMVGTATILYYIHE